jgi:hypothetical protein
LFRAIRRSSEPVSILILILTFSGSLRAGDHLVAPADIHARVEAHTRERKDALDGLEALMAAPLAVEALARSGLKKEDIRRRLEGLRDEELQDLHRRAAALRSDPAAGSAGHVAAKVLGVLLVLAALFVLLALILWADFCTGECL